MGAPSRSWSPGVFTCEVTLEADLESPARVDADSKELIAGLESYLTNELQRVFAAASQAGADVFQVGKEAIRHFSTWEAWRAYGFADRLKDTRADFRVKIKLSHSPRDPALE